MKFPANLFTSRHFLFIFALTMLSSLPASAAERRGPSQYETILSSGPIPDMKAFTAEGEPLKIRELTAGKYTVLSSGCLTCPEFHKTYPEIEAASADYSDKGVQFFYFYKSLRHPEMDGFLQAQNMKERLLQLAEARKKLGTKVPWIADTIDDSMRIGLGANSQSVYVISPEGKIVYANGRIIRDSLRRALDSAVGKPQSITYARDLGLPTLGRRNMLPNEDSAIGVQRPDGLTILRIAAAKPDDTYYVKLRAEADAALLKTGTGRLFLGFYPDPIHDVHWNNLTPAMKYTLTLPDGVVATPVEASAEKGPGDKDTQPRQFWVDVKSKEQLDDFQLKLKYYACAPGMCMATTHEYTISFEDENRGSRTAGMNRGNRGRGGRGGRNFGNNSNSRGNSRFGGSQRGRMQGRQGGQSGAQLAQADTNKDGAVTLEEMTAFAKRQRGNNIDVGRIKQRFDSIDANKDGKLSTAELGNAPRPSRQQQR